jgi:Ca2+-binding RTX toxin-like protein
VHALPRAVRRASGQIHYLIGRNPALWRAGLPTFAVLEYRDLWPGIDLLAQGREGGLELTFRVRPGGSPEDIRIAYVGGLGLSRDSDGTLAIETPAGVLRGAPLTAHQEVGRRTVKIESALVMTDDGSSPEVRFSVGSYDPARPLVVGPVLAFSTFVGGRAEDGTVDLAGNAYVTGWTTSSGFPVTPGAYDTTHNGGADAFVTKLDRDGSSLVYSTFLGGSDDDRALGIVVDGSGNVYVSGLTFSSDFPATAGSCSGAGDSDPFVLKLNAAGSVLDYALCFGGTRSEAANEIEVDGAGKAFVVGWTTSPDFPATPDAFDPSFNGGFFDAFVVEVDAAGSDLLYATYLGGDEDDRGRDLAVDAGGNAYVTGWTFSPNFPTTPAGFDTEYGGGSDGFAAKLSADGSTLLYSTYLGGAREDRGLAIQAVGDGRAYVSGRSASGDFPAPAAPCRDSSDGETDAYALELAASGSALLYSTCFGGTASEVGYDLEIDAAGNAYVTGWSFSSDFPTTSGAFAGVSQGGADAYLVKLSASGSTLLYATYLGGSLDDHGKDVAVTSHGTVYVTGDTRSPDFPTTPGAFDTTINADPDAFVTKLALCGDRTATLVGTEDNDVLIGGADGDVIQGLAGDDLLEGAGGTDRLCGGAGRDSLRGGAGGDVLDGQAGNDVLDGGPGPDALAGGAGQDLLNGGTGSDDLRGDAGNDRLRGGTDPKGDDVDVCDGGGGTGDTASGCESVTGVP